VHSLGNGVSGDGVNAWQHNLAHTDDIGLDVFGAPLGRTVALVAFAFALDKASRRRSVIGLDANRMGPRP